jgi:hypothetical protein
VASEKTAVKRPANCSGSCISQLNNPSRCNGLIGRSYFLGRRTKLRSITRNRGKVLVERGGFVSNEEGFLLIKTASLERAEEEKPQQNRTAMRLQSEVPTLRMQHFTRNQFGMKGAGK